MDERELIRLSHQHAFGLLLHYEKRHCRVEASGGVY